MAGQDGDGGRKRKAADGGRGDPPKRSAPSSNRSTENLATAPDMRSLIDRYKARKQSDAGRSSGHGAAERSASRKVTSSQRGRTDQRPEGRSEGSHRHSEQRTESRKRSAAPSRPVETEEQVVAGEGPLMVEDPASSGVDLASAENPVLDKGKAVDASDERPSVGGVDAPISQHVVDSSPARGNFFQFRFEGPGHLYQDKTASGELIYSVRGAEGHPDFKVLAEREAYEQFARTHVRSLVHLNDMVACYEFELAKARKEAEDEKSESARLRETNERLKGRLRYLKEIEVPAGRATQIRGTLNMAELFRDKLKIKVPQSVTDKLARDLELYTGQVEEIAEVKLHDEDLL